MSTSQVLCGIVVAAFVVLCGWLIRESSGLHRKVRVLGYLTGCALPLVLLASWDPKAALFAAFCVVCVTLLAFLVYDAQAQINQGNRAPFWWNWL